jgi:Bacterial toxin of type II toxin-antitoxin system, YafQ
MKRTGIAKRRVEQGALAGRNKRSDRQGHPSLFPLRRRSDQPVSPAVRHVRPDHQSRRSICWRPDRPLPQRYFDHPLSGEWSGFRDCHIRPDLVLIYEKPDVHTLRLVRLGSHSELGF